MLYTTDASPDLLAAAVFAGFFPFASEYSFPGRPLAERGLLNLELGGPECDVRDGDPGGRLILDLAPGSTERLSVGKRSVKSCVDEAGSSKFKLTVSSRFEESWEGIVAQHGVDWCGFEEVRGAYSSLHARTHGQHATLVPAALPRVVSVELWDKKAGALVSAEVGAIVGRCYVCLSLFSRSEAYPRCDWVRAQASILWLRRAGVELFDAGTTAEYYARLFGFRRCGSRHEFVQLWRSRRSLALAQPEVLGAACEDVGGLLTSYAEEVGVDGGAAAWIARRRGMHEAKGARGSFRPEKRTVQISGLPPSVDEAALVAALRASAPDAIGASSIKTVSLVGKIASAFVTFSDEAAQRGALALDGCAIPLDGNDAAPILHVAPHGRKRKGHGNHSHSTVASASAAWYKMAPPTGAEERPRARQPSTCEIALTPCGPTTVALKLMWR